ncbi:MAG: S8 family peptidase [Thermodesulfobacteriota bacterium]
MKTASITPMISAFGIVILLVMLCAPPGHAFQARLSPDGQFSLHCENTPLRRILTELARQGVAVRIDPGIDFKVSADYENKPVARVLDAILKDTNHALIWDKCTHCTKNTYALAEIQIFRPGEKDNIERLARYRNFELARHPDTGDLYVRNEALIRVRTAAGRKALKKLAADIGGAVAGRSRFGIYRVVLPEEISVPAFLKRVRQKGIGKAEFNYAHRLSRPRALIDPRIEPPEAADGKSAGKQFSIAVFDSGLAPEMRHKSYVSDVFNAVDPDAPIADIQGHGTQMTMVAAGAVDPIGTDNTGQDLSPVMAIQGFDENGITSNYTVMKGLEFAMDQGARVLSLSWHTRTASDFLKNSLKQARKKGLVVISAAGNKPTGDPVYPAAYPDVVAVGALAPDGEQWDQSNFGDFVDVQAPGFANLPVGYQGPPGIYAGTSIATAYTARQVAGFLANHPDADTDAIRQYLASRASSDDSTETTGDAEKP